MVFSYSNRNWSKTVFFKINVENTALTFKCLVLFFSPYVFQPAFLPMNSLTQEGIYISLLPKSAIAMTEQTDNFRSLISTIATIK